ncbi:MAG: COX15/CtaA family protein [Bacteroidetes bacterium]|nr:COX15/CtaA family protein [Bacteroidota bacterium]
MNTKKTTVIPKSIGYWLMTGAVLVALMVILGGYTRLSHSGLSMVTWKPVTGFIPPLSEAAWVAEFDLYKTSPEYKLRNYHFSLDEFKAIYWPEFYHRLLGRIMGLAFIVPFFYFLVTKKLRNRKLKMNLLVIFILGLLQGFAGWYMVKSGLVDQPAVSHIRLAIHLSLALILFGYLFTAALRIIYPAFTPDTAQKKSCQTYLRVLLVLVSIQIIYGAFVAGLKAGLFYPTFPKMGNEWFPVMVQKAITENGLSAFTNSPYVVQFMHRWLAVLVLLFTLITVLKNRKRQLADSIKKTHRILLVVLSVQFLAGVLTLINLVPVWLGVVHQLGALAVLGTLLMGLHLTRSAKNELIA